MIDISVTADFNRLAQQLRAMGKQVPFAAAQAINAVAFTVKKETGPAEMRAVFSKPTPWTLRSLFVKKATKHTLRAVVGWGQDLYSKSRASPDEILGHQILGGARREKGLEMWLRSAGYIGSGEFVVPGAAARMDAYGNMSRGQVMQVISQLRIGSDSAAWKSDSAHSKRNVKRAGRIFWSRGGHLPRGAWVSKGGSVAPLLVVITAPKYQTRLNIRKVVQRTVAQNFEREFRTALSRAMANPKV
ncbi:MAG: hypothetical protein Q8M09_12505 [Pseudomonadota bacterium]|nr:hypothetical protein [Pseudomonadota bacterium]MDP1905048.1 hypothetical protein [Pseudomonadota bacterium]MDP2354289.1 hypothetical protein [Pseudomonadota bacterium]